MMRRDVLMNMLMDCTLSHVAIDDGGMNLVECDPEVDGIQIGIEIEVGGIPEYENKGVEEEGKKPV